MRLSISALALALLAGAAPPARSGPPAEGPRPVLVPWTFGLEQDGPESVLHHAAGLAYLSRLELALGVTARLDGDAPLNSVVGLLGGRLGPLAFGAGLSGIGDGPGSDSTTTRLDLGLALRLSDGAALGLAWHGLYSDASPALDAYGAWSLSLDLRPLRALALAIGLDRFDTPELDGTAQDAVARVALAFRPGTERVTLGLEAARTLGDEAQWTLGGTLRTLVIPGLTVGAYGRWRTAESGPAADAVEAGALLELAQGGFSLGTSFDHRATHGDGAGEGSSLSVLLKVKSERNPSLSHGTCVVVKLPIRGPIPERPAGTLFGGAPSGFAHWLEYLDVLTHDPDVAGLVLQIQQAPGWAQMWELRAALARFKAAGKRVHAVLTVGDMRALYLASAAHQVHLHRAGGLFLTGLAITRTYLFGLMEKLGVKAEIVKYEDYKSASEAWTRTGPSEPAREQDRAILDGVFAAWRDALTTGRAVSAADLDRLLDGGPQTMHVALAEHLVDHLVDDDAVADLVAQDLPGAQVVERYVPSPTAWRRWGGPREIAILPVVGSIVDGPSAGALPIPLLGGETTGDASFIAALEAAVADGNVIGVVVRVDSGGGSAIASDKMHRAIAKAAEKKPVVVSFGEVAASGGYYLAVASRTIMATPLTITGSIGIFSGKADTSGLYALLGLTTATERTGERADMMHGHRPWTERERELAHAALRAYYDRFLELVAAGRKISVEEAQRLARGRVWLGTDALAHGLVDSHAGLWDAIAQVRAEAGVDADEPLHLSYRGTLGALSSLQRLVAGAVGLDSAAPALAPPADLAAQAREVFGRLQVLGDGAPLAMSPFTLTIE